MKNTQHFSRLLFFFVPLALFLLLYPKNIYITITIALVFLGAVYQYSHIILFRFALFFLLLSPFFWIVEVKNVAEHLVDFAFFFLFAGIIGQLFLSDSSNDHSVV